VCKEDTLLDMTQISVVVIDGQRTFTDALSARLGAETDMTVVATAESVASTRRLLAGRHVDTALLDPELPDSLQLAAEMARVHATAPEPIKVIMLGSVPEAARIAEALRAGVTAWVRKEEPIEHLLEVIRGVMRGETQLPPMLLGRVLRLLLDERDEPCGCQQYPLSSLTPREREVLSYLVQGIGRREIADRMQLSANTVRSHLQNLMAKLGVHTTLEAVALARRTQAGGTHFKAS
jgi:DNA-binding NarL/FixJ family response regulator